jgi:hypothetical protein
MSTAPNPIVLVFAGERNKSGLITPAASNCESADSLNDFSNNPQIAAQEGSLHCENQLDLALINERHVDGQSTDSDSTAKSSQAGSDTTIPFLLFSLDNLFLNFITWNFHL